MMPLSTWALAPGAGALHHVWVLVLLVVALALVLPGSWLAASRRGATG